jgi:hypothetical protein
MLRRKSSIDRKDMNIRTSNTSPLRIQSAQGLDDGEIRYSLSLAGKPYQIYFRSSQIPLYQGVEPMVVLALLPAMKLGLDILSTHPVSPDFIANLDRFMEVFCGWFPDFHKISLLGKQAEVRGQHANGRTGVFFTGGVDSFYTLMKHQAEITDLVYVHGFDVSLDDYPRRKAVSDMCRAVADRLGKRFVEVETNARRLLKGHTKWGKHAHGTALACIGHVLSSEFEKIFIASSFYRGALFPWGSHPDTDPLLASPSVSFIHDGCEARRTEKIESICRSQAVMDHLRVCWTNVEGTYNCGKCEKCIRTMISLYALGKIGSCRTLPAIIDPSAVKNLLFASQSEREFVRENLVLMDTRGLKYSPIRSALQKAADRPAWFVRLLISWRKQTRKLLKLLPDRRTVTQIDF